LKVYTSVKNFTGTQDERKLKAYKWGCFFLGGVMGMKKYADKCTEMGIPLVKAQNEGTNTQGGVLVPQELDNYIVDLREAYGVFRGEARVAPMTRDTLEFPRRTGGLTASFKAEAEALAESTKTWDSINLVAKKLTALAKMSVEVMEDAIINLADDLAGEIGYAFAQKEDDCGFNGDTSTTYGGIYGASPRLKAIVGATTTSAGGIVIAAGNTYAEVVVGDLLNLISVLPQYAEGNAKWYCSRMFHWAVLERLERAAGGVTLGEQRTGSVKTAFGYPVVISQVLNANSGTATSEVFCLFGDLRKSSTFGDRRQTTISISDQAYWANDQVGIKGTERFDIVNHDLGTATVAGPLVGLQGLNS
jgi:HK97 family phage major capsid protein